MSKEELTDNVIKLFHQVYNTLGYGFPEDVYEKAMIIEFDKSGLKYTNQHPVKVYYGGEVVGDYVVDFIVEDKLLVEINANKHLARPDETLLLNYLTSTKLEIGLLLNFGIKPESKRKIYDKDPEKEHKKGNKKDKKFL